MFECRLRTLAPIVGLVSAITATTVLRADSFTPIAKMQVARSGHQATLLDDGRVLVTGGSDDGGAAINRAEVFNPVTRSWADVEPNIFARVEHAATLLQDGRVVVVGGASTTSSCEPISAAEIYESRTGTWSLTRDIPIAFVHGPAAVRLADGRVLVSGGGTPCGSISRSTAIFDPASNAWLPTSSMNVARQFHTAVLMGDGRVLATGGASTQDGEPVDAEAYDPATGEWTIVTRRPVLIGTACDGYVQSFAALLDPVRSVVSRATDRSCSSTTVLPRTRFLVAGGTLASGRRLDSAEVFEPLTEGRDADGSITVRTGGPYRNAPAQWLRSRRRGQRRRDRDRGSGDVDPGNPICISGNGDCARRLWSKWPGHLWRLAGRGGELQATHADLVHAREPDDPHPRVELD